MFLRFRQVKNSNLTVIMALISQVNSSRKRILNLGQVSIRVLIHHLETTRALWRSKRNRAWGRYNTLQYRLNQVRPNSRGIIVKRPTKAITPNK